MGLSTTAGHVLPGDTASRACRVAVVNEEAAELYFGGQAIGSAVIDSAGRRSEIVGVVRIGATSHASAARGAGDLLSDVGGFHPSA